MDRASQVLAQALPVEAPITYAALSDWGDVRLTTIYHRAHGRRLKEEYAQSRQDLTPEEEKAVVKFLLLMSSLGYPVRIKFLPSFALSIARRAFRQTTLSSLLARTGPEPSRNVTPNSKREELKQLTGTVTRTTYTTRLRSGSR
jgi:hypothetical protein